MDYDLIVRNGLICDGSGDERFHGDIGVRDGRIVSIGLVSGEAKQEIDAGGLVVAPGFIDPHTHYDAQLVWDGFARPSLAHGVTTIVPGNCSLSLAPLKAEHRELAAATFRQIEEMPKTAFDAGVDWSWESFDEYIARIRKGLGINVAPLVGHSLIRLWVMGEASQDRVATDAEIAEMQSLLRACMRAGAVGMSGSWVDVDHRRRPVAARLAEPKEIDALCAVLGECGGILQIVPEFWDKDIICARIDLLADRSRRHNIQTTTSPLFDSLATPELVDITFDRIRLQAAHGARVTPQMQTRPIDLSFSLSVPMSTFATLPNWWALSVMSREEKLAKLKDEAFRQVLRAEMDDFRNPVALELDFAEAFVKKMEKVDPGVLNRKIGDIAKERNCHIADAILDITLADDLLTSFGLNAVGHRFTDKNGRFLNEPLISVGAGDGGAHLTNFSTYGDTGYLFAEYVRRTGVLSLELAVHKLTGDLARIWGLKDRGLLKVGYKADLVIFDPDTIDRGPEVAEYDLPDGSYRYFRNAIGVARVFVNGQEAFNAEAGYTGKRAGEIAELKTPVAKRQSDSGVGTKRAFVQPRPGDDWTTIAARAFPDLSPEDAVSKLKSWNLYVAFRPVQVITPTDVLFVEPPLAA
jgi:N-acyl-D-aspartate/D-glutamate deacylase